MQYDNMSLVLSHILLSHKPPSLTTPNSPKVKLEYHVVYRIYFALLNKVEVKSKVIRPSTIATWVGKDHNT